MIKIKKTAFTLSEALIALSVVGVLGILVLPGIIKDSINKANITLLQSTISHLSDAIQTELVRTNVTTLEDTLVYKNPRQFLRNNFDVAEECEANSYPSPCRVEKYSNYDGSKIGTLSAFANVPTLLSNGVTLDFQNDNPEAPHILVSIDLNGKQPPNIAGVDLFFTNIIGKNDPDNLFQVGDIKGLLQQYIPGNPDVNTVSNAKLKSLCATGYGTPCYLLLERAGFDHNYLENNYPEINNNK